MQIYLLRHAVAASRDARRYPRDAVRPLTADGKLKMKRAARGMKALGLDFDLILTSPLTRARQTARIVAREMKPCPSPTIHRPLAPGGAAQEILARIPQGPADGQVLLVGHEPDLSRLASLLLSSTGALPMEMKKGALCRIDVEGAAQPGAGRLVFLLQPKVLRHLY